MTDQAVTGAANESGATAAQNPGWLLLLLGITFAVLFPYRNFAGDDAYITFRFAHNLANGLGFSFNPGEATYGSTAPIWVALIAGVHLLGIEVQTGAHLLNWLFGFGCVAAMWGLSGLYLNKPGFRFLACLLLILNPWFVRWAISGMENNLVLFVLVMALWHSQLFRDSARWFWVPALWAGIATLCRPEMVVFSGLLFLDQLVHGGFKKPVRLVVGAVLYLCVVVPWLLYAQHAFGTVVPNTVLAKISKNYSDTFVRTVKFFVSFWLFQAVGVLMVLTRARLTSLRDPETRRRWFLILAWAVALPAFYLAGGAPVAGRYLAFGLPSYVIVGTRAWEILREGGLALGGTMNLRATAKVVLSAVASFVLMIFVQYKYCWYLTKWPEGMDPRIIGVARFLKANSKEGESVAADQIGVLGYFSERYVLDIFGLVSPEMFPFRKSKDPNASWRYVRERAPEYLFVIDDIPLLVSRDAGYASLELLKETEVQREGAASIGAVDTYRLYRTHWKKAKSGE